MERNVGTVERIASLALGGLLAYLGFRSNRAARAGWMLLGAGLAGRGATGRCPVYRAANLDTSRGGLPQLGSGRRQLEVEQSITVNRERQDLYQTWRKLDDLPRILRHLESVQVSDGGGRSHWIARAPGGSKLEWDAEILEDRPGECIAWQSLPGSELENEGRVRFTDAPPGRGSQVELRIAYRAGAAGSLGPVLRKLSEHEIREDLRHFKQWMEAGEVPTTEGQPSGRRGRAAKAEPPEARPLPGSSEMKRVRPSAGIAAQAVGQEGGL
ncbi:MAG TPA: YgaP-like transmembrane domain [Myxococcota bacterium]|nr:YgaP-like transmembrane domain [Myxococcota bacterium]